MYTVGGVSLSRRGQVDTGVQRVLRPQSSTDPSLAGRPSACLHWALRSLNHSWRRKTTGGVQNGFVSLKCECDEVTS